MSPLMAGLPDYRQLHRQLSVPASRGPGDELDRFGQFLPPCGPVPGFGAFGRFALTDVDGLIERAVQTRRKRWPTAFRTLTTEALTLLLNPFPFPVLAAGAVLAWRVAQQLPVALDSDDDATPDDLATLDAAVEAALGPGNWSFSNWAVVDRLHRSPADAALLRLSMLLLAFMWRGRSTPVVQRLTLDLGKGQAAPAVVLASRAVRSAARVWAQSRPSLSTQPDVTVRVGRRGPLAALPTYDLLDEINEQDARAVWRFLKWWAVRVPCRIPGAGTR